MKDIEVLAAFIQIYCDGNHGAALRSKPVATGRVANSLEPLDARLCDECSGLLIYAAGMRIVCPYDPKPRCKKCVKHCYSPRYRRMIRDVMKYAGKESIKRGRLSLLWKYLF